MEGNQALNETLRCSICAKSFGSSEFDDLQKTTFGPFPTTPPLTVQYRKIPNSSHLLLPKVKASLTVKEKSLSDLHQG